jgi:hypothetical protein
MNKSLSIAAATARVNQLHAACSAAAKTAVETAIECGRVLIGVRRVTPGGFTEWVQTLSFSERTAYRYIKVAEQFDLKANLLDQGAGLVDLYREFGIVRECKGGGYRSDVYQARKAANEAGTDQLFFAFEDFTVQLRALHQAPQIEKLSDSSLDRLETDLKAGLDRIHDLQAKRNAIAIDVAPSTLDPRPSATP